MHQCRLEITNKGQSTNLVMGTGKYHFWRLDQPVAWWTGATSGSWVRRTNSTKFRAFSLLELLGPSGSSLARLPEQPYEAGDTFKGTLISKAWIFQTDGESFDVKVKESSPTKKKFRTDADPRQGERCDRGDDVRCHGCDGETTPALADAPVEAYESEQNQKVRYGHRNSRCGSRTKVHGGRCDRRQRSARSARTQQRAARALCRSLFGNWDHQPAK